MGLQDLEKLLGSFFEGIFSKGAHQIQPVEIARELVREMSLQRRVSISRVYAPNLFVIRLGRSDYEKTAPLHKAFGRELEEYARRKAAEKGYTLIGSPRISFLEDQTLGIGEIEVEGSYDTPENGEPLKEPLSGEEGPPLFEQTMVFSRDALPDEEREDPELFLVIVKGPDQGRSLTIDREERYLIGRKSSNHLILSDINASREHAAIEYRGGSLYLSDLGSRNGTFINGVRVRSERRLESGDQIHIGENQMQIEGD